MFEMNTEQLKEYAYKSDFLKDMLEKVLRLSDVLNDLQQYPIIRDTLALKGGTAINMAVLNMPRLSVDIDMDYCAEQERKEMLVAKKEISKIISNYMEKEGYVLSKKSKTFPILDSRVYDYKNAAGNKDSLKIELNYVLRKHLLPLEKRSSLNKITGKKYVDILTLSPIDIFAAKINALLSRGAARDLYDTYNLVTSDIFKKFDHDLFRKAIVFYGAISQKNVPKQFKFEAIDKINYHQIMTDLQPVIHKHEKIDLPLMQGTVKTNLRNLLKLKHEEKIFLSNFAKKKYTPEILFKGKPNIVKNVKKHPMAMWKMQQSLQK